MAWGVVRLLGQAAYCREVAGTLNNVLYTVQCEVVHFCTTMCINCDRKYICVLMSGGCYNIICQGARGPIGRPGPGAVGPSNIWMLGETAMQTNMEAALAPSTAAQYKII